MSEYKLMINNQLVAGEQFFDVINPSTEEVIGKAPHATQAQVDAAIDAAVAAQPKWADTDLETRRAAIKKAGEVFASIKDELTNLLVTEQGKPLSGAGGETGLCLNLFKDTIAIENPVDVVREDDAVRVEVQRKPVGVCVGITPWNFPLFCSLQKFLPAIVLGNTFVWKPSPFTPLTALRYAEAIKDVFPPGVLNVVTGDDKAAFNVGAYLTSHPKINKVSFTGSVRTGKAIMAAASKDVKRITLEMGGNDAAIVRGDCDPKETAKKIFDRAFANTGQICCAIKRCFVQKDIYDEFVKEITVAAQNAKFGDGFEAGVEFGPLNNKMQFDRVKELVEDARSKGANILTGGKALKEKGFFYAPTIVTGVKEGVRIVDEEQFGPVLPVIPYDTDDEALFRANNTEYGLGGSIWSKDSKTAVQLANKMQSGTVWVNDHLPITGGPFGGFKTSGLGRELGKSDLLAYTELQTVYIAK